MKRIYIVRHAKSSWADLAMLDKDRPLNARGKRDAPRMAQWCVDNNYIPELLISSTATRAMQTSAHFVAAFESPEGNYQKTDSLYHAPADTYLENCYGLSEETKSVMLFGHNPGITYLANEVSSEFIANVATSGILIIDSTAESWTDLSFDNCRLIDYKAPKLI